MMVAQQLLLTIAVKSIGIPMLCFFFAHLLPGVVLATLDSQIVQGNLT